MARDGREEISADLFPASWRDVPIYVQAGATRGGRKVTPRPILNSDAQDVADVGLKQRKYSFDAFVSARYKEQAKAGENDITSSYKAQRIKILAALEQKGTGTFVHPFEGEIKDLIVESFSLQETISKAGIGKLSIQFVRQSDGTAPEPKSDSGGSGKDTKSGAGKAEKRLVTILGVTWEVDPSFVGGHEEALVKLAAVYKDVDKAVARVESVAAEINGFASTITQLNSKAASIITTPLKVATSVQNAFTAMDNIFPTQQATFDAMVSRFGFGLGDAPFSVLTAGAQQKRRNFDIINTTVRTIFLARAYSAAVDLEFTTLADINAVEATLDAEHQSIVAGDQADAETKEILTDLRVSFFAFLAEARLTALKISPEIITVATPRVLAYQLYGSDALDETIAGINSVESYELLSGSVQVLTS